MIDRRIPRSVRIRRRVVRSLPYVVSAVVGIALLPSLYLGLAYRRGQTLSWAPRWAIPLVQARTVKPPKLAELIPPNVVPTIPAPKAVQARSSKKVD